MYSGLLLEVCTYNAVCIDHATPDLFDLQLHMYMYMYVNTTYSVAMLCTLYPNCVIHNSALVGPYILVHCII